MSNQQRIEILEQMKNRIAADYEALNNSTNEIYSHHLNELSKIRNKKLLENEELANNMQLSAESVANGESYQNDSDLEEKNRQIACRIGDFIAYKQKRLNEKFPEAMEYFASQGYKSPIKFSFKGDPPHFTPPMEFDTSDEPLFTQEEIEKDINIFQETANTKNQTVLKGLQSGDHAVLTVSRMPPIHGTIGKFFEETFEFKIGNRKPLIITFHAIERGQATIQPSQ